MRTRSSSARATTLEPPGTAGCSCTHPAPTSRAGGALTDRNVIRPCPLARRRGEPAGLPRSCVRRAGCRPVAHGDLEGRPAALDARQAGRPLTEHDLPPRRRVGRVPGDHGLARRQHRPHCGPPTSTGSTSARPRRRRTSRLRPEGLRTVTCGAAGRAAAPGPQERRHRRRGQPVDAGDVDDDAALPRPQLPHQLPPQGAEVLDQRLVAQVDLERLGRLPHGGGRGHAGSPVLLVVIVPVCNGAHTGSRL